MRSCQLRKVSSSSGAEPLTKRRILAQAAGVSRAVIDQAFAGVTSDPNVLAFDRRQRGEALAEALRSLPERCREVIFHLLEKIYPWSMPARTTASD